MGRFQIFNLQFHVVTVAQHIVLVRAIEDARAEVLICLNLVLLSRVALLSLLERKVLLFTLLKEQFVFLAQIRFKSIGVRVHPFEYVLNGLTVYVNLTMLPDFRLDSVRDGIVRWLLIEL